MNQYPLSKEDALDQLGSFQFSIEKICSAYLDDDNNDGLAKARANKGIELCIADFMYYSKTFTLLDTTYHFHSGAFDVSIKIKCKYQGNVTIWMRSK